MYNLIIIISNTYIELQDTFALVPDTFEVLPPLQAWVAAAIAAAAGIASSIMANSAAKKQARNAYSQDVEMWNKQNEYNDPKQQMQRLSSAGLNPNLVYGGGSVTGNTSGSTPQYHAPKISYDNLNAGISGALSEYQDFRLKDAQVDNIAAQTRATIQSTINDFYRQGGIESDSAVKYMDRQERQLMQGNTEEDIYQRNRYLTDTYRGQMLQHQMDALSTQNRKSRVDASILENYGEKTALQQLRNLGADEKLKVQDEIEKVLENNARRLGIQGGGTINSVARMVLQSIITGTGNQVPFQSSGTLSKSK